MNALFYIKYRLQSYDSIEENKPYEEYCIAFYNSKACMQASKQSNLVINDLQTDIIYTQCLEKSASYVHKNNQANFKTFATTMAPSAALYAWEQRFYDHLTLTLLLINPLPSASTTF